MNEFFAFALLIVFSLWLLARPITPENPNSNIMNGQLRRLWQDAQQNYAQNDVSRAERSLLALLKLDGRNIAAYNRLGIMYARQGLKEEAIECFEISSSITPNASALHNLAIAYFGNRQYQKAARAFEHAIEKDPENPSRHIALAKTLEKMEEPKAAIKELEKAHKLSPGSQGSIELINAYKQIGAPDLAAEVERESIELKKLQG